MSEIPTYDMLEQELSQQEKSLRECFVNEYLKDFDPYQAALRCGFLHSFALDWSKKLMLESYVQRRIAELTRLPVSEEQRAEKSAEDRSLIENTLREAMQRGPYAGRIAAARALAEMFGWAKPDASADAELRLASMLREFATSVTP